VGRQWFWLLLPKQKALSLSKGGSAAGPKPGITEKHGDTGVREKEAPH